MSMLPTVLSFDSKLYVVIIFDDFRLLSEAQVMFRIVSGLVHIVSIPGVLQHIMKLMFSSTLEFSLRFFCRRHGFQSDESRRLEQNQLNLSDASCCISLKIVPIR